MLKFRLPRLAWILPAAAGLALFVPVLEAASQTSAQNCNNLRFGSVPDFRWQGEGSGYNPFTPQAYTQEGKVEVRSTTGTCTFFVTFAPGNAGTFSRYMSLGISQLPYNIYDSITRSNVLKDLQTANDNEVLTGAIPVDNSNSTETVDLSYYVYIDPGQIRPAGDYSDTVTLTLYRGTMANYTQMATRNVRYRALIPKVAEASVVPSGAMFDANATQYNIDFGMLQEGNRDRLDLLVRTNAGYKVELVSQNKGMLRRIGGASGTVPYRLTVNGGLIDLNSKVTVAERSGVTPSSGDRFPMLIEIGTLADAVPGNYRDDITVIVRTTD